MVQERLENLKTGLTEHLRMSVVLNKSKVEHWFGDINQKSGFQGNSLPKKDWEEFRRLNAVNYMIRTCETPFTQQSCTKKSYQNIESLKISADLRKVLEKLKM